MVGSLLAMRPSPRQQQLARLRALAVGNGLRVRLIAARPMAPAKRQGVDYLLPWQVDDLAQVRAQPFMALVNNAGQWLYRATEEPLRDERMLLALGQLPASVVELNASDEGLAARWDERGAERDVERIAVSLGALREAWRVAVAKW